SLSIIYFFHLSADHQDLHSFPTRRSSDLLDARSGRGEVDHVRPEHLAGKFEGGASPCRGFVEQRYDRRPTQGWRTRHDDRNAVRSEEHTSELQSRGHLVCRLLLEKKKRQA